jgi:hypothetical protein
MAPVKADQFVRSVAASRRDDGKLGAQYIAEPWVMVEGQHVNCCSRNIREPGPNRRAMPVPSGRSLIPLRSRCCLECLWMGVED